MKRIDTNHTKKSRMMALLLCMALLMMFLGGCGNTDEQQQTNSEAQNVEEDGVYITLYLSSELKELEEQNAVTEPGKVETVDDMTATMVTIIPKDSVNAETIVDAYNESVVTGLYGESMVINEVKTEENQVWVDFDSESLKALPLEEGTEGVLFYHLARSITDNLSTVDHVYLTMDGGQDFRLAHLWFEASRPFYSGVMPTEGE